MTIDAHFSLKIEVDVHKKSRVLSTFDPVGGQKVGRGLMSVNVDKNGDDLIILINYLSESPVDKNLMNQILQISFR